MVILRHVVEGRKKLLGPTHQESVESLNNLAIVLGNLGEHGEAEEILRSTINCCENGLERVNPEIPRSFGILGRQLECQGNHEDADVMYRRAIEGYERTLGAEHPHTLSWLSHLAQLLESQKEYDKALPLYRKALTGLHKVLGPDHPEVLKLRENYLTFVEKLKVTVPNLLMGFLSQTPPLGTSSISSTKPECISDWEEISVCECSPLLGSTGTFQKIERHNRCNR